MPKTAEEKAEQEARQAERREKNRGNKFTGSDAIALGTTLTGTIASFGKGLRYDPEADKPAVYNPFVSAPVGDPNYDRYINEIEKSTASANRNIRVNAGSDTNKGILGILEADRQGLQAKDRVQARHSELLMQQRQRAEDIRNQARQAEVSGENRFRERRQDRDVRGSERAQDAAKGAIESGAQYFADKDANQRNATVLERQANDRLDIVRRQEQINFDATYIPLLGRDKTKTFWEEGKEERDKFYEPKYGNVYGTRDAYLASLNKDAPKTGAPNIVNKPIAGAPKMGVNASGNSVDLTGKLNTPIDQIKTSVEKPGQVAGKSTYDPVQEIRKFFKVGFLPKTKQVAKPIVTTRTKDSDSYGRDANYPDEWTRETFEAEKADMDDYIKNIIETSLAKRGL